MLRKTFILLSCLMLLISFMGCGNDDDESDTPAVSSRAYKGHENDLDANNLCSAYPAVVGTRIDDCRTCHTGEIDKEKNEVVTNTCDYCHELMVHGEGGHTFAETLNTYGADYYKVGRTVDGINQVKDLDSDGDGYSNDDELKEFRYPGSNLSQPGQPLAPTKVVSLDQMAGMPAHDQFMLANASKQQFDDYVGYKGVTIKGLLSSLGISSAGATGITVIAPDGFAKTLKIENVDKKFPQPLFFAGLGVDTLGTECGFVSYPETLPAGLVDGQEIPGEHYLMVAYDRDGKRMDPCYLDSVELSLKGEGPFRLVVPQSTPGSPDRGLKFSPSGCNDDSDYDENKDHNAGSMVRGVVAIRIDPMPSGVEEFDYKNGGWAYIDSKELLIYGNNVK